MQNFHGGPILNAFGSIINAEGRQMSPVYGLTFDHVRENIHGLCYTQNQKALSFDSDMFLVGLLPALKEWIRCQLSEAAQCPSH